MNNFKPSLEKFKNLFGLLLIFCPTVVLFLILGGVAEDVWDLFSIYMYICNVILYIVLFIMIRNTKEKNNER